MLCGSALHGVGVQPLLDAVTYYLPSPPTCRRSKANRSQEERRRQETPQARARTSRSAAWCSRSTADKHGDLHWVRVYSGDAQGQQPRAATRARTRRKTSPQLWHIHADQDAEQVDSAAAGDIVGVIGLRHSITGDTLCDTQRPDPAGDDRVSRDGHLDGDRAGEHRPSARSWPTSLEMLKRQDPTFRAQENEETGQTLISGMGELHLEVIKHRLLRDFNLNVHVHKPRVSYRETVDHAAEVTGECHRQQGGQPLFAKVKIRLEPFDKGSGPVTVLSSGGRHICPSRTYRPCSTRSRSRPWAADRWLSADEGQSHRSGRRVARDRVQRDRLPLRRRRRLQQGPGTRRESCCSEPIMKLEITVPEDYLGDFISDLQQRRAVITHTQSPGPQHGDRGRAPLANFSAIPAPCAA